MQRLSTQAELAVFRTSAQGNPYVTYVSENLKARSYKYIFRGLHMAGPGENEAAAVLLDPLSSEMSRVPLDRQYRDTSS